MRTAAKLKLQLLWSDSLMCLLLVSSVFYSCDKIEAEYVPSNNYTRKIFDTDTVCINDQYYEIVNPYKQGGRNVVKGSLHNHTKNSKSVDGFGSGELKNVAKKIRDEGGYDFYCFTDHNYVSGDVGESNIIWMGKSVEDTGSNHHIVVYNLPHNYKYHFISEDINTQIDYYHSIGAVVSYAHPDWHVQYQSNEKISSVVDADFVEVYNTVEGGSVRAYNILMQRTPILALGVDDYHSQSDWPNPNQYLNGSFIYVFTDTINKDSLWGAILKGNFYASTGAKFRIRITDNSILVETDRVSSIYYNSPSKSILGESDVLYADTNTMRSKYKLTGQESMIWISVVNEDGEAISNPFRITKI